MNGHPVEIWNHVALFLVELSSRVFLVLGEKLFEIFIFHCAAQNLLVQLFDNLEVRKRKYKKVGGVLAYKRAYDALGT